MTKSNDDSIFGMIKLGVILAIYAVVSCTVLAVVNNFTSAKIAQNQLNKVNQAMEAFFPGEGYKFETVSSFESKVTVIFAVLLTIVYSLYVFSSTLH